MSFKIKTIAHKQEDYLRDTTESKFKTFRSSSQQLDGFERAKEYTKAVQAAKMQQMFAQPFVAALSGHCDGVYSLAKHSELLNLILSASTDGVVKIYDIAEKKEQLSLQAHRGWVTGTAFSRTNLNQFFTSSLDGTIKLWSINGLSDHITGVSEKAYSPIMSYEVPYGCRCFDISPDNTRLVSGGESILLFDPQRSDPVANLRWGYDEIQTVTFSPSEPTMFAVGDSGCNLTIYDSSLERAASRFMMRGRVNKIKFNPRKPHEFLVASEDRNVYLFDVRNSRRPLTTYHGHTNAVLDVDYSPTGHQFVSSSFDETIRIWDCRKTSSLSTYFTKRMTKVHCCLYTNDSKYVVSGSLDANVRVWKAKVNEALKYTNTKEDTSMREREALLKKYSEMPEIKKITKTKYLPKHIRTASHRNWEQMDAEKRKIARINETQKKNEKYKHDTAKAVVKTY